MKYNSMTCSKTTQQHFLEVGKSLLRSFWRHFSIKTECLSLYMRSNFLLVLNFEHRILNASEDQNTITFDCLLRFWSSWHETKKRKSRMNDNLEIFPLQTVENTIRSENESSQNEFWNSIKCGKEIWKRQAVYLGTKLIKLSLPCSTDKYWYWELLNNC